MNVQLVEGSPAGLEQYLRPLPPPPASLPVLGQKLPTP